VIVREARDITYTGKGNIPQYGQSTSISTAHRGHSAEPGELFARKSSSPHSAPVVRRMRSVSLRSPKTHPAAVVQAAVQAGVTDIGENYLQEASDKFIELGWPESPHDCPPVLRHAIGHIQTNKARLALRWFDMIHTVDSVRLAEHLARVAAEAGRVVPVLLQINISKEPTKSGFFF